jgi:hypothetical protein
MFSGLDIIPIMRIISFYYLKLVKNWFNCKTIHLFLKIPVKCIKFSQAESFVTLFVTSNTL